MNSSISFYRLFILDTSCWYTYTQLSKRYSSSILQNKKDFLLKKSYYGVRPSNQNIILYQWLSPKHFVSQIESKTFFGVSI